MENKRVDFSLLLNKVLGLDKAKSKEDILKIAENLRKMGNEKIELKEEDKKGGDTENK